MSFTPENAKWLRRQHHRIEREEFDEEIDRNSQMPGTKEQDQNILKPSMETNCGFDMITATTMLKLCKAIKLERTRIQKKLIGSTWYWQAFSFEKRKWITFAEFNEDEPPKIADSSKTVKLMVNRTERGWGGHYIMGTRCRFKRNTLLQCGRIKVVVSSVGLMKVNSTDKNFTPVSPGRYFETMAFHVDPNDERYNDADIRRQINFDSPWHINKIDADDKANLMHETVVGEITEKLKEGVAL